MERSTNREILHMLLDAFGEVRDPAACIRLRQAIYVHGIVDAVLSERVARLPEYSQSWVRSPHLDG